MNRITLTLALVAAFFVGLAAQEAVTLSSPVVKTQTSASLVYLGIDVANGRITVQLTANTGDPIFKTYDSTTTPTGAALLSALNTSNNTTTSLIKRVYQRLITDGVITGTVGGTPQ